MIFGNLLAGEVTFSWMVEPFGTQTSLMQLKDAENKLMMIAKSPLMLLSVQDII
jgi:hypothetical protein